MSALAMYLVMMCGGEATEVSERANHEPAPAPGPVFRPNHTGPTPLLPGDAPGPNRPHREPDTLPVRDAVPQEVVYQQPGGPPKRTSLIMISYRNYATRDHLERAQAWHVMGLELSPMRRYARLSLVTEFGFEGGQAAANGDRGDLFLMQKIGVGVQYPHWVTPFVEFQGGGGVGRIEMFERNDLGIFWSVGLDVGAQWNVAGRMRLMAAAGWIRPTMLHAGNGVDQALYFHRGTFKVGVGF